MICKIYATPETKTVSFISGAFKEATAFYEVKKNTI